MSRCNDCGCVECRNGPSCKYLAQGNCTFCHCSDSDNSDACPDCGYELGEYVSLEDHRTEEENACDHDKTTTRGEREICYCCGADLGYWQSNEEFYDTIGAPYDEY